MQLTIISLFTREYFIIDLNILFHLNNFIIINTKLLCFPPFISYLLIVS